MVSLLDTAFDNENVLTVVAAASASHLIATAMAAEASPANVPVARLHSSAPRGYSVEVGSFASHGAAPYPQPPNGPIIATHAVFSRTVASGGIHSAW
jgi:hypothetical protein